MEAMSKNERARRNSISAVIVLMGGATKPFCILHRSGNMRVAVGQQEETFEVLISPQGR